MTIGITSELVERMVALVQDMSAKVGHQSPHGAEACAIAALLPNPVDPDLIEARKLCADAACDRIAAATFITGQRDAYNMVIYAKEGIKRGRQLAAEGIEDAAERMERMERLLRRMADNTVGDQFLNGTNKKFYSTAHYDEAADILRDVDERMAAR